MATYGNGDYAIYKTYYDSPRCDCNAYYEDCICYPTMEEAIDAYYHDCELYSDEPIGLSTNFNIPLAVRMQHGFPLEYTVRKLNGDYVKTFNFLSGAKSLCENLNKQALHFRRMWPEDYVGEIGLKRTREERVRIYIE